MRYDDSGAGTFGPAGEVRLGDGTAALVGSLHRRASVAVLATASTMPASVDVGAAAPLLTRLLGGVAGGADLLADLNAVLAVLIGGVERDLTIAEDAVADAFAMAGGGGR